jgi:L-amino acid N-acyltransferase YncA
MGTDIRLATGEDAPRVASFFSDLYETRHGIGSASSLDMLQRTVASLFVDDGALTVFVSEASGVLQGVAAARHAVDDGTCDLISIQASDSVQGRGFAQTLLGHLVENCAARGGNTLTTSIPSSDVRARGFLRREGFVASAGEHASALPTSDETITYVLDVEMALARSTMSDEDPDAADS